MTPLLGRLWAIARMTLLEASRRKVFAVLLVFAVALLSSAAFFPSVDMEGRLRLIEVWSLRAAALFTAVVALFFAGYSLPGDFEQKRVFLLVTKPVSKTLLFLGRLLGFMILLAAFVAVMGVTTLVFIHGVKLWAGPSFPPLRAVPRFAADAFEAVNGQASERDSARLYVDSGGALVWTFEGIGPRDLEDPLRVETRLSLGAPRDPYRAAGRVRLILRNEAGRVHEEEAQLNTNEDHVWEFPPGFAGAAGTLRLEARPLDEDGYAMGSASTAGVLGRPLGFELNFMKGLGLVYLQSLVVLGMTLAASTVISGPLSILLGILVYVVGSAHSFVREGARDIDRSLSETREAGHRHGKGEELPPWVLRASVRVSEFVLGGVPDFDRFDFSKWLLKDRAVTWTDLGRASGKALVPLAVLSLLGALLIRFRDFG